MAPWEEDTHLGVVNGRTVNAGEEVGHNATEERQVDTGELGHIHVLHR